MVEKGSFFAKLSLSADFSYFDNFLTGYITVRNLRPMQTDATSHNIVACCWAFLANNVASVYMGLKV